jgi:hypothetical protein
MQPAEHGSEAQPSYLWEMLTSPLNINLGLGALALGGVLALPLGLPGLILPLIAFGAGEAIAAMYVPALPTFREKVDLKYRNKRRERVLEHLQEEIRRRCSEGDPRWRIYHRLRDRITSMRTMARHRRSVIAERDMEKLDDACLDYLGLWLAELSMRERRGSVDEAAIAQRIAELDERLKGTPPDRRSLEKARADLEELLLRHQRLASRKVAVEAAMLALPDTLEEIYHAMVTLPASGEGGARLQEAIERLRLEEELENTYGAELRSIVPEADSRILSQARH